MELELLLRIDALHGRPLIHPLVPRRELGTLGLPVPVIRNDGVDILPRDPSQVGVRKLVADEIRRPLLLEVGVEHVCDPLDLVAVPLDRRGDFLQRIVQHGSPYILLQTKPGEDPFFAMILPPNGCAGTSTSGQSMGPVQTSGSAAKTSGATSLEMWNSGTSLPCRRSRSSTRGWLRTGIKVSI